MIRKILFVVMLFAAGVCGGQYTAARGDSVYTAYLRDIPAEQQPEPYWITCVIRYGDVAYQEFSVFVLWHYYVAQTGKYRVVPMEGRPFACDNIIPFKKGEGK